MPEEILPPIPLKSIKLASLPRPTLRLLQDFRVIDPENPTGLTQVALTATDDKGKKAIKHGPILEEKVLSRFLAADHSPTKEWLPWMLHLACGGDDARKRSNEALVQIKERFIDERMRGWRDINGVHRDPLTDEQAKARWEENRNRFKHIIGVADQDMVEKLSIYGWHQAWPGPSRVYENLAAGVAKFFKIRKKTVAMNNFLEREGQTTKVVPMVPTGFPTLDALNAATTRVERFFASRSARRDVRVHGNKPIFEDENLKIIVPLTYAAAVKHGWNEWAWANRATFEKGMEGGLGAYDDAWRQATGQNKKVYVYLRFKAPMPVWISSTERHGEEGGTPFRRHYMTNLALELEAAQLKTFNPNNAQFYDEENRKTLTLAEIKKQMLADVARPFNPEEEEYPIYRGPGVYQTQEEAQAIIDSLDNGLAAVKAWGKTFAPTTIVSDYMPAAAR